MQHELAEDVERRVAGVQEDSEPRPARRPVGEEARAHETRPLRLSAWARSCSIRRAGSPLGHRVGSQLQRRRPAVGHLAVDRQRRRVQPDALDRRRRAVAADQRQEVADRRVEVGDGQQVVERPAAEAELARRRG